MSEAISSFRGASASEAEEFVQAVRRRALAEKKQFDYTWMAAYAGANMIGPALRWHMGLAPDVQRDWGKLEVALLDRFATEYPSAAAIPDPLVPTSASAAPLLRVGRIRILDAETNDFLGYIAKPPKEQRFDITYTPDHDNAVVVQFAPSSSLVTFDLVGEPRFQRMALRVTGLLDLTGTWFTIIPIYLTLAPKPSMIRYSDPPYFGQTAVVQHAVWTVNADCSITAAWPPSPEAIMIRVHPSSNISRKILEK